MKTLDAYELEELTQAVLTRIPDTLLHALTLANRTGELDELLRLLSLSELIVEGDAVFQPKRVVVLGDSAVKEAKLRSIVRRYDLNPDDFEFSLGYTELKHYDFAKLRNRTIYRAVLVGPMPHSTSGARGASSIIAEIKNHPSIYPPLIELRDSSGLKITNNSFSKGLERLEEVA